MIRGGQRPVPTEVHKQRGTYNPTQEAAARTRHLNMWLGADEALFSMRSWHACTDRDLELSQMEGRD
jgi:phage terminase large subunit-like protein